MQYDWKRSLGSSLPENKKMEMVCRIPCSKVPIHQNPTSTQRFLWEYGQLLSQDRKECIHSVRPAQSAKPGAWLCLDAEKTESPSDRCSGDKGTYGKESSQRSDSQVLCFGGILVRRSGR